MRLSGATIPADLPEGFELRPSKGKDRAVQKLRAHGSGRNSYGLHGSHGCAWIFFEGTWEGWGEDAWKEFLCNHVPYDTMEAVWRGMCINQSLSPG